MAQTKRKRRTKHRGNAAGSIEARGRTSKQAAEKNKKDQSSNKKPVRGPVRGLKPPTIKGAAGKAGVMALLLFGLAQLGIFGSKAGLQQAVVISLFAFFMYVPLSYVTDKAFYNRRIKREGGGGGSSGRRS